MGFQDRSGSVRTNRIINGDLGQQYRNGVPFAVVVLNTPIDTTINLNHDMGVYIQDSWTMKRLTLNPGIRWDYFNSSIPAQTKPAGRFVGEQHFEAIENVPNWHNVTPRFGASFDPTGSGRTALKANFGVYVTGQGPGFVQNYNPSFTATDTRTWDDRNRDDIAQENEIGPGTTTFGVRRNQNADPDLSRPYQIVWDAGVQHEVFPGLGVSVSYNQRSVYKDLWTNNLAIQDSDYILLTVPDPRGNGELLPVYNLPPDKFGLVNELDTNSDLNGRIYRGVDATFSVRIPGGGASHWRHLDGSLAHEHVRGRESEQPALLRSVSSTTFRCKRASRYRAPILCHTASCSLACSRACRAPSEASPTRSPALSFQH